MANDDAVLMGATSYAPMVDFQLPQAPELPQQPPESEQGFLNQFYGAIGQTIFQDNPRLSGRAIEGLGRVSGSESMKRFGESIVADFDDTPEHEVFVPRVSEPQDIDGIKSAFDYLGSTLGQGLGSMAMTVGGAAVGAGGGAVLGSVVPGAGTVVGAAAGGATGSERTCPISCVPEWFSWPLRVSLLRALQRQHSSLFRRPLESFPSTLGTPLKTSSLLTDLRAL